MRAKRAFLLRFPWKLVYIVSRSWRTFDILWQKKFPRAQRAEISVKAEKIGKMLEQRAFLHRFAWNLMYIVYRSWRTFDILWQKQFPCCGNQHRVQHCVQSTYFCFNYNEIWYTMIFPHNKMMVHKGFALHTWSRLRGRPPYLGEA